MNKLIKGLSLIAALTLSGHALAQGKIAVVDPQRAILETDIAKERLEALRKDADYVANKKQIDDIQAEAKKLLEKAKKDGEIMTAEQKSSMQKKLQEKQADLKHIATKMQKAEQDLARRVIAELGQKTEAVITDIVKTDSIGLILDAQSAIFADPGYDITAKVTQRLNDNK